ncbi:MAG: hypothetical protein M0T70_06695 [Geobacteraceae bacterium]|nr:hypothetical protein [Geobacteraceae bacterium]
MASKRNIRRRQCGRKMRFESHDLAMNAMYSVIRAGKKRGGFLHVYRCRFCSGYHFGHAVGKQQGAW